jgi:hypothetical protein
MGFYRKKPVIIEAFKWTGDINQIEDPEWIVEAIKNKKIWFGQFTDEPVHMIIHTLEGDHRANPGDWIIQGVNQEIYPCKTDIFEKTYEEW